MSYNSAYYKHVAQLENNLIKERKFGVLIECYYQRP